MRAWESTRRIDTSLSKEKSLVGLLSVQKCQVLLEAQVFKFAFGWIPMLKKHFYIRGDAHLPVPDNPSLSVKGVNICSIDWCVYYSTRVRKLQAVTDRGDFSHQGKHRLLVLIEDMPLAP